VRSRAMTSRARLGGLALVALGLLVACGGTGGDGDGPSVSPTRTPTATLPGTGEPTSEAPTETPTVSPTETPTPSPTRTPSIEVPSPTRTPTATVPSPTRTPSATTPPQETTTPSETASASETPTASPSTEAAPEATEADAGEDPSADDEVPPWVWWAVAALVVGCVVAVPLVVRARRRAAWRRDLERQESEVEWFARELLPELRRAGSHEEMAGGWAVSQNRVAAAEDALTVLESAAPDEAGRARARTLRDALRSARDRMRQLSAPAPPGTWALDLDTLMIELETALRPASPTPPPG
jgi:hypothetical protein